MLYRERYINFVPFISLVLVTLRGSAIAVGDRSVSSSDCSRSPRIPSCALNLTELPATRTDRYQPSSQRSYPMRFPFFVWLVVAYPVVAKFLPVAQASRPRRTRRKSLILKTCPKPRFRAD